MSLFDQLGKIVTIPNAQATADTRAPASQESSRADYLDRLEQSKAAVLQQISDLFAQLGKAYYESHADDHQTEFETQLSAIRDAFGDIAQCEKQAEEITNRRRCPSCGAELVEGSVFCNFCGTKLAQPQPAPESTAPQTPPAQRLCPKCNAVLQPDDIFCASCGADLRNGASTM